VWDVVDTFQDWWLSQPHARAEAARNLFKTGRMEFAGGEMTQFDEAMTTHQQIVDLFTAGHEWIRQYIGPFAIPRSFWSTETASHSSTMALLLHMMGFQGSVLGQFPVSLRRHLRSNFELDHWWNFDESPIDSLIPLLS